MPVVRPFGPGARGDHVRDLQSRLRALGCDPGSIDGAFGDSTERAVAAFQHGHGIDVDGIVGPVTWRELVEAGYDLGDRLLYLQSPMLRGEDVSELQRRLGRLGFDAGRIDGILGRDTAGAIQDFQRNTGLGTDGICGPATIDALDRYGGRLRDADPVALVRERERLRSSSASLDGQRLAVGEPGGLAAPTAAVRRALADTGVRVLTIHHPDGSKHAHQANTFAADVYLGLAAHDGPPEICFYEVPGFVSHGGRLLADLAVDELSSSLAVPVQVRGMRLPVLRETRMPAVVCRLPAPRWTASWTPAVGRAWSSAIGRWAVDRLTTTAERA
ncbi:MAG: peptidoglycan-binding protein [Actinomycetota bacterium]